MNMRRHGDDDNGDDDPRPGCHNVPYGGKKSPSDCWADKMMKKLFKVFKRKKKDDDHDKERKDERDDEGDGGDRLRNSQLREAAFNGKLCKIAQQSGEEGGEGDVTVLRQLLDAKANINSPNRTGQTALHFAAARGRLLCVKALLAAGARADAADESGNLPIHFAAMMACSWTHVSSLAPEGDPHPFYKKSKKRRGGKCSLLTMTALRSDMACCCPVTVESEEHEDRKKAVCVLCKGYAHSSKKCGLLEVRKVIKVLKKASPKNKKNDLNKTPKDYLLEVIEKVNFGASLLVLVNVCLIKVEDFCKERKSGKRFLEAPVMFAVDLLEVTHNGFIQN
ncbi:hypothetical protein GUITHDRAFT_115750 [Guillardia theta CCMP2712]|uniref:Uncharacterized protein n=1 Tax=Guillardia theta (strain CCMP2712) TaxID=905079 RepID=L1IQV9_GUITC|nr:hypothetical protein GUITHDRAFT_115750 [Guillardia theta CCMP2712]EKX38205.1 hypothetical protein GUITHDRAFT_115750 [Guillardia theta CCMP2712]|eukprot:XP_005825185.1 hypothetical protein GUITHDRAFT_115750 [Guillardia theta CCMP2712]